MKTWVAALAVCLGLQGAAVPAAAQPGVLHDKAAIVAFDKALTRQYGDVVVGPAKATLHLGTRYYFVPADDAKAVIVKLWGNPPDAGEGVLGIVFEKDRTSYDNDWGAVVTYDRTGHVSDKDAASEDYDALVAEIRANEQAENPKRQKAGYPTEYFVGWAQAPTYDSARHALIWARNIRFSDSKTNVLNYDVRLLGRDGVLSLNMISGMPQLLEVRGAAQALAGAAHFAKGATYADYDPSVDKTAAYGLAGLVAAGAGVAVAKKLGLLAILLALGKKFLILFLAAGAAITRYAKGFAARLRGRAQGGSDAEDEPDTKE
ncbi:DUF2167 domain-containing protein [Sphingomonas sp. CV7422]|uniref:DUF2167 domain-containing protein n=1 Tax=Sphingomonas sp. CV7422 TaxID=3018036 RepID=UPI0022FEDA1E|nr:DUF2167 domain-containing protein [Sphingomonas sp. CV7422]